MSNNKNILDLSTQLDLSLIDRFIKLEFENIKQQILYGPGSKDEIWEERKFWLGDNRKGLSWKYKIKKDIESEETLDSNIKDVIRFVFGCVGDKDNKELKERLLNHVRLSVSENSKEYGIATIAQYIDVVSLIESWLKEILAKLEILKPLQRNPEYYVIPQYGNGNDGAMLGDIVKYLTDRFIPVFKKNDNNDNNGCGIKIILEKYRDQRNDDLHWYKTQNGDNAFSFIKYTLYDVISFVYYLIRYYKLASKGLINKLKPENTGNDDAIEKYINKPLKQFEDCVEDANRMTIAFKYKNEASDSKLHIEGVVDAGAEKDSEGFSNQSFEIPDRRNKYILRTIQGGKVVSSIEFNPDNYYNGAVVGVTLPTEKIPELKIDGIINQSTRLMEHTENRKVLEYVLDQFMKSPKMNEEARKNLRVLFMLDSDEKTLENLMNKFGDKVDEVMAADDAGSETGIITESEKALLDQNFDSLADDFKNMLTEASNSLSNKFEENMRHLEDCLSKNLNKDLDSVKDEILGSLRFEDVMAGQDAILKKIDQINAKLDNWEKNYERIRKNDREEGKKAYENLLSEISKINDLSFAS